MVLALTQTEKISIILGYIECSTVPRSISSIRSIYPLTARVDLSRILPPLKKKM